MQVTLIIIIIIIINLLFKVYDKSAVLCTSLPYFVYIQESFGITNIIYAKQFRTDVKLYRLT